MGFNNRNFGGRRDFQRRPFGGRDRDRDRQMYDAVCTNCGNSCQVPFRPTGDKPIYCNDCFSKFKSNPSLARPANRDSRQISSGGHPQNNEQFNTLNAKLDKIIAMLATRPSEVAQPVIGPEIILPPPAEPAVVEKKKRKTSKKSEKPAEK